MSDKGEKKGKREKERHLRVQKVWNALKPTKHGKPLTAKEIAAKTGYSHRLVSSTITLIQNSMKELGGFEPLTYNASNHTWKIARSWDEKVPYIVWLRAHLATRASSLKNHADVAAGVWPGEVPREVTRILATVIELLDVTSGMLHEPSDPPPMSGPTRVEQVS